MSPQLKHTIECILCEFAITCGVKKIDPLTEAGRKEQKLRMRLLDTTMDRIENIVETEYESDENLDRVYWQGWKVGAVFGSIVIGVSAFIIHFLP